jgi:hypothetical protein
VVKVDDSLRGMTTEQMQHAHAFTVCMAMADQYIRDCAPENELATVVAEDIPEMRDNLKRAVSPVRSGVLTLNNARLYMRELSNSGFNDGARLDLGVRRVVDDIHFTPKDGAPLLQVADAVAFGFRRYYSLQSHGLTFAEAIKGVGIGPPQRNRDCECGYLCQDAKRSNADTPSAGSGSLNTGSPAA